ncbi:MAG TPA: META domain-containing protein [Chloroflexi bacterium]|nr:META domain-containing protein [Chloroflexota bacterium]
MVISLLVAACMPGPAPIVMPESPLIPGTNTALVENRFRVVEIIRHGEPVVFDAIQPVFITFDKRGELSKQTTNCNSDVYAIVAESERRYRLIPGAGTAKGCGELAEAQYSKISEAIGATTEYELKGSQLLLRGEDVHIVLEVDNP